MPTFLRQLSLMTLLLFSLQSFAEPEAGDDKDLSVNVEKNAGIVTVDARMAVNATQQEAWNVLTDYDHMAQFFPNLVSSKVVGKDGDKLRVEQKGNVSYGPFSFPFDSVRDIELTPYKEIQSRAVSGSLKSGKATTRLVSNGSGTWILYHSESEPGVWVPPAIGPQVIANQTRSQFESLRDEILKRKSARKTASW